MLSEKIEQALNHQLRLEAEASFKYLAMAAWCDYKSMEGAADFFYAHAEEEREHMMKVLRYIVEVGGYAKIPDVQVGRLEFESILQICEMALTNEQEVTKAVHMLVDKSMAEHDHATYDFLRFFVEEQKEEEVLFQRVIDRIKLIGEGPQSLYFIDQELAKLNAQRPEAEAGA